MVRLHWTFTVLDIGKGVSPDAVRNIFHPPPPSHGAPNPPVCGNREQPIGAPIAPGNFFLAVLKGLENCFRPPCFSLKCSNLNSEFTFSIQFPPPPWPRVMSPYGFLCGDPEKVGVP